MTHGLLALQTAFQDHLLASDPAIAGSIAAQHGIPAQRRLLIYHHAYRARLVGALRDSFGHTATYLGEEWFEADALAFVEGHPSTHASLNAYGAGFAAWLLERHPRDPDIGELAALDWALRRAFDGADATPLSVADLAAIAPPAWSRIGFALVPTAALLALTHNTIALWHALDQQQPPPRAVRLAEPGTALVWRRGHQPHFRSLDAVELRALSGVQEVLSFAAVCERLAADFPRLDTTVQAGTLLRRWIDEELLCAVVDPALVVPPHTPHAPHAPH